MFHEPWARQGVLLLNACLTVRKGEPHSHAGLGWEQLTDAVVRVLSARSEHLVFVLWGGAARKRAPLVDVSRHTLIVGAHPASILENPLRAFAAVDGIRAIWPRALQR